MNLFGINVATKRAHDKVKVVDMVPLELGAMHMHMRI